MPGVKKVDQKRKNKVFNLLVVLPATEDLLGLMLDVYMMLCCVKSSGENFLACEKPQVRHWSRWDDPRIARTMQNSSASLPSEKNV